MVHRGEIHSGGAARTRIKWESALQSMVSVAPPLRKCQEPVNNGPEGTR